MRDPDRIPMILGAVERLWREDPDLRLGQVLLNALSYEGISPQMLGHIEDGRLLDCLGAETEEEARYVEAEPQRAREGWKEWMRRQPDGEDAWTPPVAELFCDNVDHLLLFAPVDLALEVASVREALEQATTWGDVKRALSSERLNELVESEVGGPGAPTDDEPFEAPERWPLLRYSDMPDWLPRTVGKLGQNYSGRLDSGTNYLYEYKEEIVAAIEKAGVTVRSDGPDLEDLFDLE
jgi:hypothetical protein